MNIDNAKECLCLGLMFYHFMWTDSTTAEMLSLATQSEIDMDIYES